jgi:hypothetical protein
MGIYSVDKLIAETRRIAKEYRLATGKTLPVTPEIAINDAISILDLLANDGNISGYDAIYAKGEERLKVQIKGRVIFNEKKQGHRIGQLKIEQQWDAIILVIMNADFMPEEIYIAKRDVILHELEEKKKNNKKGAMTLAKFKIISELLWTEKNGFEQCEAWSNKDI